MQRLVFDAPCAARADALLVFLPGAYDSPADLAEQGFAQAVRDRALALDVWLVDAHLGYYNERSIVERLDAEVIAPARAQGYRSVWLAGISIGGFGSLLYAQAHPGAVQGVIAIAPYLGARSLLREIESAGGAAAWAAGAAVDRSDAADLPKVRNVRRSPAAPAAPAAPDAPDAAERALWRWLATVGPQAGAAGALDLTLAYGREDRLVAGHRLLAAAMPQAKVITVPGGHDWPPWRALWSRILDRPPAGLRAACSPPPSR